MEKTNTDSGLPLNETKKISLEHRLQQECEILSKAKKRQAELFKIVKDNIDKIDQLKLTSPTGIINLLNEEYKTNFSAKEYRSIRKSLEAIDLECSRLKRGNNLAIPTISAIIALIVAGTVVLKSLWPYIIFVVCFLASFKSLRWFIFKNYSERAYPKIEKMVLNDSVMDFADC